MAVLIGRATGPSQQSALMRLDVSCTDSFIACVWARLQVRTTPLHAACESGKLELVQWIADDNSVPLDLHDPVRAFLV